MDGRWGISMFAAQVEAVRPQNCTDSKTSCSCCSTSSHWTSDTLHVLRCVFKRTLPRVAGSHRWVIGSPTTGPLPSPCAASDTPSYSWAIINYPSSLRTWLKIGCPWLSLWHLPPQPRCCAVDPSQAPRRGSHVTEVINGHGPSATWHVAPAVSLLLRQYESRAGRVPVAGWPIRHCQRPHGDEWFRETRQGWRGEVWAGRVLGVCSGRVCVCWTTNDELTRNPDCGCVVNRSIRG